jgi:hypothetical protein
MTKALPTSQRSDYIEHRQELDKDTCSGIISTLHRHFRPLHRKAEE